jgi:hypothetical protein
MIKLHVFRDLNDKNVGPALAILQKMIAPNKIMINDLIVQKDIIMANTYDIVETPTLVLLNDKNNEIYRSVGSISTTTLNKIAKEIILAHE